MNENFSDVTLFTEHTGDNFIAECLIETSPENTASTNSLPESTDLAKIKFFTLMELRNGEPKDSIAWCMKLGVISSKYSCPKCHRDMKLISRKDRRDGYIWSCRKFGENQHNVKRSVRKGSLFSDSKMNLMEILMIIHCWVYRVPFEWIIMELNCNKNTLTEWVLFCGRMCVDICASDTSMIGGEGKWIEIVGGSFKVKECACEKTFDEEWVFSGFEKGSDRCFFKLVMIGDKMQFYNVIKSYVLPGTTIFSDFFTHYDCFEDEAFINLALNNSYTFDDPVRTNGVNAMTNFRIAIRHRIPKLTADGCFQNSLGEYVWRKKNAKAYDKMRNFIQAIKDIYPPSTEDD